MTFECAATFDGVRCRGDKPGDTVYLKCITFCAEHQEVFEEVAPLLLTNEIAGARLVRMLGGRDWLDKFTTAPKDPTPARMDQRHEALVYFIRCGGYIKIGYSIDPLRRLGQLQSGDGTLFPDGLSTGRAAIIRTLDGGYSKEQELHKRFAHLRHTGEWFTEAPDLTGYIESLEGILP